MTERIKTIHCDEVVVHECEQAVKEVFAQCTPDELKEVMRLLTEGGINGCQSAGERCCLIGTIAKIRGISFAECIAQLNAKRKLWEIEYWFFQICSLSSAPQNTENNHFALYAYIWCEQIWLLKQPGNSGTHAGTEDLYKQIMGLVKRLARHERRPIPLLNLK